MNTWCVMSFLVKQRHKDQHLTHQSQSIFVQEPKMSQQPYFSQAIPYCVHFINSSVQQFNCPILQPTANSQHNHESCKYITQHNRPQHRTCFSTITTDRISRSLVKREKSNHLGHVSVLSTVPRFFKESPRPVSKVGRTEQHSHISHFAERFITNRHLFITYIEK